MSEKIGRWALVVVAQAFAMLLAVSVGKCMQTDKDDVGQAMFVFYLLVQAVALWGAWINGRNSHG